MKTYKIYSINAKGQKVYHVPGKAPKFGSTSKRKAKVWKKESSAMKHIWEASAQGIESYIEIIEAPVFTYKKSGMGRTVAHKYAFTRKVRDSKGHFMPNI